MIRIATNKLVGALSAVFGASVVAFLFMRVFPGNPARLIVGPLATNEAIVQQEKAMGLDQPLWTQYWRYIKGFVTGDWGFAYSAGEPVRQQIGARLPATLELGFYAFLFAFVLAVLLALAATYRRRPVVDGLVRGLSFFGLGTPPFWFGLIALLLFSQVWDVFPGPRRAARPELHGAADGDALLHDRRADRGPVGTAAQRLRTSRAAGDHARAGAARVPRAAAAREPARYLARELPRRRAEQGSRPLACVLAPRAAERVPADAHGERAPARAAPHRLGAGREGLQLARVSARSSSTRSCGRTSRSCRRSSC